MTTEDKKIQENNLTIYNKLKEVPDKAQKKITGGRLNGMTDIKPMWRIEKLTEVFGICGFGWKTKIKNKEIIEGANGEKIAIVDIDLFVKINGEWSEPIEGTGGSSFISNESKGLYTSDECYKMAYTDALSVACKSLGMGASIYWGDSKYDKKDDKKNDKIEIKTLEQALNYHVNFGKHAGESLADIVADEPDYANWLIKNGDETIKKCLTIISLNRKKKTDINIEQSTKDDMIASFYDNNEDIGAR